MKNAKTVSKEEAMNNQPPFNEEEVIACEEAFNEAAKLEKEKEEAIENASNKPLNYENYLDAREEVLMKMDKIKDLQLVKGIERHMIQELENQFKFLNNQLPFNEKESKRIDIFIKSLSK